MLAALQWRRVVETTRAEAAALGQRYIEVQYESFLADSTAELARLYERSGLTDESGRQEPLAARNKSYDDGWTDEYRESLIEWMEPLYSDLGYRV